MKVAVPLPKNVLTSIATIAFTSAIDGAIRIKMRGKGVVRTRKGILLVILNEDMNDIIGIIKSSENSGILIDRVSETVKHEIKR